MILPKSSHTNWRGGKWPPDKSVIKKTCYNHSNDKICTIHLQDFAVEDEISHIFMVTTLV